MRKMRTIMLSMLAVVALASCSKDDNGGIPAPIGNDNAYLSIALNAAAPGTYAESGPTEQNGTAVESGHDGGVIVVGFASDKSTVKGVYTFGSAAPELGTIGGQGTTAVKGTAFKVSKDIKYIFVVLNPTAAISAQINAGTATYAAMNQVITSETIDKLVVDNKFLMTSAGADPDDKGLVEVTPSVAASETATDISAAKTAAESAPAQVKVDRAMVKASVANFTPTASNVENGTASVDGWKANTTNTKYLPYAELVAYTLDGTTSSAPAKYRKDANYSASTAYATEFNWLDNNDNVSASANQIVWNATAASEYIFENTMEPAAQDYNNTTKVIVKAKFAPTGVSLGQSWFRVGGILKTFAELDADYSAIIAGSLIDATYKAGLESFLNAVLGSARTKGWTDEGKGSVVTLADLDGVENGGYLAAKATPKYVVEYFQKSVCYYDVNLKHDNRVAASMLGRWGVVRNNCYTLNITKISKAGKPYIPDPTDPDITDPENPDPDEPTDDDEASAFISVEIEVNPWTAWTQEVEL